MIRLIIYPLERIEREKFTKTLRLGRFSALFLKETFLRLLVSFSVYQVLLEEGSTSLLLVAKEAKPFLIELPPLQFYPFLSTQEKGISRT